MNKKLISLAAAAALLSASLGTAVFAAEPVGYDYVIYEIDFEECGKKYIAAIYQGMRRV